MRAAFIASAYRTIFFREVARLLEQDGHEILWLSPNRRWASWLLRQGVAVENILDITRWGEEWRDGSALTAGERQSLAEIEQAGTLRMRNIVLMDYLLGCRSETAALKYLAISAREVTDFLRSRQISLVFGEQTWAFELLTGQVCKFLGLSHYVPHTVRIPDPRFAFFDGPLETNLIATRDVSDTDRAEAEEFLRRFRDRYSQPAYMKFDRAVLRFDWDRIKLLTRHVIDLASDPFDETSRRPIGLLADHTKRLLRGKINSFRGPFVQPSGRTGRPFVLFPLHLQPEASIDIKGAPYTNQIELVRAMVRTLPVTHDFYVKEHTVALPFRTRDFYRQLARIPGVKLIDPRADSFELIINADLIITITGTAAYEAALLGKPAATIAPIFFDEIVQFPRFNPFGDSLGHLLLEGSSRHTESKVEFLAWLYSRTFPGTVGDALWQPASLAKDNLSQVANGFLTLFDKYD